MTDHVTPPADERDKHWLTRRSTIRALWRWGSLVLALFVAGDTFVHPHAYFWIDATFAFYAWYGFATCVAMILFAKGLGVFLKREDTYYDDE